MVIRLSPNLRVSLLLTDWLFNMGVGEHQRLHKMISAFVHLLESELNNFPDLCLLSYFCYKRNYNFLASICTCNWVGLFETPKTGFAALHMRPITYEVI